MTTRLPKSKHQKTKKLIAETAWHHQGDSAYMLALVDALCQSAADCVKIHLLLDLDEYMHTDHPLYPSIRDWMLPESCWKQVMQTIIQSGKTLLVLCNDRASIDLALAAGATGLELHAAAVHDAHLFQHLVQQCAGRNTEIFIGIGALPLEEVDALYQHSALNLIFMFGIQNFPTRPEYIALARQRRLMALFPKARFGYADHTEWDHPHNLLLSLLGAVDKSYLEKHVTLHPGEPRVDYEAAVSVEHLAQLRQWLDLAGELEGDGRLVKNAGEVQYGHIGPMRKGMLVTRNFSAGEPLDMEAICFKRTARTSDVLPVMLGDVDGYRFKDNVMAGTVLSLDMLEVATGPS